jgi:hypothetical protein
MKLNMKVNHYIGSLTYTVIFYNILWKFHRIYPALVLFEFVMKISTFSYTSPSEGVYSVLYHDWPYFSHNRFTVHCTMIGLTFPTTGLQCTVPWLASCIKGGTCDWVMISCYPLIIPRWYIPLITAQANALLNISKFLARNSSTVNFLNF